MNNWLFLKPEGLGAPSADWPVCYGTAGTAVCAGTLAEAGRALQGKAVNLILPMEACSWLRSAVWPGRRRPRPQALAYAVEEQLAQDPDALHVVSAGPDKERRYPVLVIARPRLRSLLALLAATDLQIARMQVDADLLPNDHAYAAFWADRWILGGALEARLALPAQALDQLRPRLPEEIRYLDERDPEGLSHLHALFANAGERGIDLLQGEFRLTAGRWRWTPWLLMLMTLGVSSWGFALARSQHVEALADELHEKSVQQFQALYPQQTSVVDLPAQLRALQHREVQPAGEIVRLSRLAREVIGGSDVEVRSIEFDASAGWKLAITVATFNELERLRERGIQSALPVRLDSASKGSEGVQALLIMEQGTP